VWHPRKAQIAVALGVLAVLGPVWGVATATATGAGATAAAARRPSAPPKTVLLGHNTFWECPARTTALLIAVNRLDLHPGQTLNVDFIVKNEGATACNYVAPYAGVSPGPTTPALQVGPCGSMGFVILGAHRRNVWPGSVTFSCPALGFAQLQPGASVVGSGSWNQNRPTGTRRMPVGLYTVVVDGHFDFPIKVEAH
jgi:hypothetical protein